MRILSAGTIGPDVADWQSFLIKTGYYNGSADGEFGAETEAATKAFQQHVGLTTDGLVGNQTVAAAIQLGFKPLTENPDPEAVTGDSLLLDVIAGVSVYQLADSKAVFYTAGMDVDADGSPHAYNREDTGLDVNEDARDGDEWVGIVVNQDGEPVIQNASDPAPGFYVSTTSLEATSKPEIDPLRYVNASQIPYIVIPGDELGPAQIGHPVLVIDENTGKRVSGIVADAGSRHKIGEASMFLAAQIVGETIYRLNDPDPDKFSNPRDGGTEERRFRYVVFTSLPPMSWPRTTAQIERAVDGALANLTHSQLVTVLTGK
jgi:hypothetical protein